MGLVEIGHITGVHGLRGELRLRLEGDYEPQPGEEITIGAREFTIGASRPHKEFLLITLKDAVSDRTEAETLKGLPVSVDEDQLPEPEPGEYYQRDLIGMSVLTTEGLALGEVTAIIETGANDVFEIEGPLGEVLIPFIKDVVIEINTAKRLITVDPLDGLLPDEEEQEEKLAAITKTTKGTDEG